MLVMYELIRPGETVLQLFVISRQADIFLCKRENPISRRKQNASSLKPLIGFDIRVSFFLLQHSIHQNMESEF